MVESAAWLNKWPVRFAVSDKLDEASGSPQMSIFPWHTLWYYKCVQFKLLAAAMKYETRRKTFRDLLFITEHLRFAVNVEYTLYVSALYIMWIPPTCTFMTISDCGRWWNWNEIFDTGHCVLVLCVLVSMKTAS